MVKRRRSKGKILTVEDNDRIISDPGELYESALSYFSHMLADDNPITEEPDLSYFNNFVNEDINDSLCKVPGMEELKRVVFGLSKDASAGPDGYPAHFYMACWDIIKFYLLEAVEDFFK